VKEEEGMSPGGPTWATWASWPLGRREEGEMGGESWWVGLVGRLRPRRGWWARLVSKERKIN
jgi:hypothetical protein